MRPKTIMAWAGCLLLIVLGGCAHHQASPPTDIRGKVASDVSPNPSVELYRANIPYPGPPPHQLQESGQPCAVASVGEDAFFYFHNLTTGYYYVVLPNARFSSDDGIPFMREVNASGQHIQIAFVRGISNGTIALFIIER